MSNNKRPLIGLGAIVIDCKNAAILTEFYHALLGWEITHLPANGGAAITSPNGQVIAFQEVEYYVQPVWPWREGEQGQMLHFDLMVENLNEAVQFAVFCGATIASKQYFRTSKTMIDPEGHPFCLDTTEAE